MTLRHMRIFVAVCECESVTAAAKKLFIAQPAASLAIAELEEYYGVKLFDRIARRLYITEAGKQFLQYAIHIVSLFDQLEQDVRNWDQIGVLRIGASITIGNYLLPEYAKAFQKLYPAIQMHVQIDNTEAVERAVLKNEIDVGLVEGEVASSYIEKICFMEDPLVLICSVDHPWAVREDIDINELRGVDFIMRERGSAGREIFDQALRVKKVEVVPSWQSVSTQAIIRAVAEGLGVSVLPNLFVKESLEKGEIASTRIRGLDLKRSFSVIRHRNKFLTEAAKSFIRLCTGEDSMI